MKIALFTSLRQRIVALIVCALALTSALILWRSEHIVEAAMLEQVKKQAWVFLLGVEREVQQMPDPLDKEAFQALVSRTMQVEHRERLGFSIFRIYFFDRNGVFLAHSEPDDYPPKKLEGHYKRLFERGEDYLGDRIEYGYSPSLGRVPKVDIIVPLHLNGEVAAALEVEINLQETLDQIRILDDRYENEIMVIVVLSLMLTFFFIWSGLHRWMLRPVYTMGCVTYKISQGELDARVAKVGKDELGQLAGSINQMADSIEQLFTEQEEAHLQMLQALAKALEAKDAYTASHSARVAKYSVMLGRYVGLSDDQLLLLKQGALMHDLGKIGIEENILNKPEQLNEHEYEIMKQHPVMTAKIMRPLKRFKAFAEIAAWHHERWDGKGYPDGLKGEEIPLLARIVGLADTWDAMTGDRIYRKAIPKEKALSIIESEINSGQWDPELAAQFVEMIRQSGDERQTA